MKSRFLAAVALGTIALSSAASAAPVYTFVGSWAVADGPLWITPGLQPLSGRQTAAQLFGGAAADYAISTLGNDPDLINFLTFLDGYADTQYLTDAQSQDFVGIFGSQYSDGFGNYSAYVFDHACGIHYCDGGGGEDAINYAFRIDGDVPEPAALGLLGLGLLGLGLARRRRG